MVQKILNHYLNSNITLYREVNHNIRYYSIKLYPTLFGEYMLVKEFGGSKNKKPTGIIRKYFSHIEDAFEETQNILFSKLAKGYTN